MSEDSMRKHIIDQLRTLADEIEKRENKACTGNWPRTGSNYWSIGVRGDVIVGTWQGSDTDKARMLFGSVFETKLGAENCRDWLKHPRTIARRKVETFNGFHPGGLWMIVYRGVLGAGVVTLLLDSKESPGMYGGLTFKTKNDAQACIDELGEETIKWALGVMGD